MASPLPPLPPTHQAGTGAVEVEVLSVAPPALAQHAAANGCSVAALPPGEMARLPPGTGYDAAVAALVEAVEAQFMRQLAAAAASEGN